MNLRSEPEQTEFSIFFDLDTCDSDSIAEFLVLLEKILGEELTIVRTRLHPPGTEGQP